MLRIPSWIAGWHSKFPKTNRAEGCPTTDCTWSSVCPGSTATVPTPIWSRQARRWGRCCAAATTDGMRRRLRYFHIGSITTVWSGTSRRRHVLLGLEENELRPVAIDFTQQLHLLIIGDSECGKTATLRTVCRELLSTTNHEQVRIVHRRSAALAPRRGGARSPDSSVDTLRLRMRSTKQCQA